MSFPYDTNPRITRAFRSRDFPTPKWGAGSSASASASAQSQQGGVANSTNNTVGGRCYGSGVGSTSLPLPPQRMLPSGANSTLAPHRSTTTTSTGSNVTSGSGYDDARRIGLGRSPAPKRSASSSCYGQHTQPTGRREPSPRLAHRPEQQQHGQHYDHYQQQEANPPRRAASSAPRAGVPARALPPPPPPPPQHDSGIHWATAAVVFPWDLEVGRAAVGGGDVWSSIKRAAEDIVRRRAAEEGGRGGGGGHSDNCDAFIMAVERVASASANPPTMRTTIATTTPSPYYDAPSFSSSSSRLATPFRYGPLRAALMDHCDGPFVANLVTRVLPWMGRVLLRADTAFPHGLRRLTQHHRCADEAFDTSVWLSQEQAATLIVMATFSVFPNVNFAGATTANGVRRMEMPLFNFNGLFASEGRVESTAAKIRCILEYLSQMCEVWARGEVVAGSPSSSLWIEITRSSRKLHPSVAEFLLTTPPASSAPSALVTSSPAAAAAAANLPCSLSDLPLSPVTMAPGQLIEGLSECLHADFANSYIGGGVLGRGCVQEEIRFAVAPELLVSLLICERLLENEVVTISGCAQHAQYTGYAEIFRFAGPRRPSADGTRFVEVVVGGRPEVRRVRDVTVVAFDALNFAAASVASSSASLSRQFEPCFIDRELTKAFAAMSGPSTTALLRAVEGATTRGGVRPSSAAAVVGSEQQCRRRQQGLLRPFATGAWGCGAFGGDHALKFLIQWLAASMAQRPLVFCTSGSGAESIVCRLYEGIMRRCSSSSSSSLSAPPPTVGQLYAAITGYHDSLLVAPRASSYYAPSSYSLSGRGCGGGSSFVPFVLRALDESAAAVGRCCGTEGGGGGGIGRGQRAPRL